MTVVYGTICLDLTYSLPRLPEPGGYVEIASERVSLGGEAANTAAALRRWGGDVVLVGNPLGNDAHAAQLAKYLAEHNLEDAIFPKGDHPAPVCHIMVTPDGERTMFGRGFAEMERRGDPKLAPVYEGGWFTADPNHGALARSAAIDAHACGMHVYTLDFVRDDEQIPAGSLWQSSTSWVGRRGDRTANCAWLECWINDHDCTAILTDGAHGFHAASRTLGVRSFPAWSVSGVVDSTGAGDVFRAGMLFGLDLEWPLVQCFKFAAAAAALNCQGLGAIAGLTNLAEVQELVASQPRTADLYENAV